MDKNIRHTLILPRVAYLFLKRKPIYSLPPNNNSNMAIMTKAETLLTFCTC